MKKSNTIILIAAAIVTMVPIVHSNVNFAPIDFTPSTAADFPQVSTPLGGPLPSTVSFDLELVNISALNSNFGSFIAVGYLNSGSLIGQFQIGADIQAGSSEGIFGDLTGNDLVAPAILDTGGIPEGTRIWFNLSAVGDTVSAQVINQADESVIYSGSYAIPNVQTADGLIVQTYDNDGTPLLPVLVTSGPEDYWEIRATRSGVDMTVNFYGVTAVPEPSLFAAIFGLGAIGIVLVRRQRNRQ